MPSARCVTLNTVQERNHKQSQLMPPATCVTLNTVQELSRVLPWHQQQLFTTNTTSTMSHYTVVSSWAPIAHHITTSPCSRDSAQYFCNLNACNLRTQEPPRSAGSGIKDASSSSSYSSNAFGNGSR